MTLAPISKDAVSVVSMLEKAKVWLETAVSVTGPEEIAAANAADAASAANAAADADARIKFLTDLIAEHARLTNRVPTPPIDDATLSDLAARVNA